MADKNYPQITIKVTNYEFNLIAKFKKHGFSAREVLALSGCPCPNCAGKDNIGYDKETGELIKIPKGILCKRNL